MSENQPEKATPASKAEASGPHLVYVDAPYKRIELSDNWKFDRGEPTEVSAKDAELIREAAAAQRVRGLSVVEKPKES